MSTACPLMCKIRKETKINHVLGVWGPKIVWCLWESFFREYLVTFRKPQSKALVLFLNLVQSIYRVSVYVTLLLSYRRYLGTAICKFAIILKSIYGIY